jgi:nucleotide-binding universal stress UspA family protein
MMVSHILVPLDGSVLAETILPAVQTIAHHTGSEVTLVRAVECPEILDTPADALPAGIALERQVGDARIVTYGVVDEQAAIYLEGVAARLAGDGIRTHTRIVEGPAPAAIIRAAGECDLIAMATRGRSGIGRWAFGSVADTVLHGAMVPVLLVRAGHAVPTESDQPWRILVPLDGSDLAEAVLPLAIGLAEGAHAEVVLSHSVAAAQADVAARVGTYRATEFEDHQVALAIERARIYLHDVSQRLIRPGVTMHTDVRTGPPADAILACAHAQHADLIVMSTHGRSGLGRWVYGSVADRVLHGATVPILVVRSGVPVRAVSALTIPASAAG